METLSKYEELRQVAEVAFETWSASKIRLSVETVEGEIEWMKLKSFAE
jgi:hypothetical protein